MKDERPASFEDSAELRSLLRQLGDSPKSPVARSAEDEQAREARMAARIDAEVGELVAARRASRRFWWGFAAAAAVVLVGFGLSPRGGITGSVWISQEPVPSRTPRAARAVPSSISQPAAIVPRALSSAALRATAMPSVAPSAPATASVASAEPRSTLAEENQLFRQAAEASRNGDVNGALGKLDRLLLDHPASPLAQTAQVRKFRLLAKAGRTDEARREAQRYLTSFPTGFAVSEARALEQGEATKTPATTEEPSRP
jgi:hypothetical protein